GGQRIDRASRRGAERYNDRSNVSASQTLRQGVRIHAPAVVARYGIEFDAQERTHTPVRVMRLVAGENCLLRMQLGSHPESFEIGHCAAATQVAEKRPPAKHG